MRPLGEQAQVEPRQQRRRRVGQQEAPAAYVARLMAGIVGIEIALTRIEGKWKVSQNQPPGNRAGVIQGLEQSASPEALEIARLVAERGPR